MPRTRECDYCGDDIEPGTGTMFVHTDGTTVHYCSAKCEKNDDLGREPRSREWTAAGQAEGGAAVAQAEPQTEADDEAGAPEADAPDLEAAEGNTEAEEPERSADAPEPAAQETDESGESPPEDADAGPADPDQGDEDEDPTADAGGEGDEDEG